MKDCVSRILSFDTSARKKMYKFSSRSLVFVALVASSSAAATRTRRSNLRRPQLWHRRHPLNRRHPHHQASTSGNRRLDSVSTAARLERRGPTVSSSSSKDLSKGNFSRVAARGLVFLFDSVYVIHLVVRFTRKSSRSLPLCYRPYCVRLSSISIGNIFVKRSGRLFIVGKEKSKEFYVQLRTQTIQIHFFFLGLCITRHIFFNQTHKISHILDNHSLRRSDPCCRRTWKHVDQALRENCGPVQFSIFLTKAYAHGVERQPRGNLRPTANRLSVLALRSRASILSRICRQHVPGSEKTRTTLAQSDRVRHFHEVTLAAPRPHLGRKSRWKPKSHKPVGSRGRCRSFNVPTTRSHRFSPH